MRYQFLLILIPIFLSACTAASADQRDLEPAHTEVTLTTTIDVKQSIQSIADCHVTGSGASSFVPPAPGIKISPDQFWIGTDKLWTSLPESGEWAELPYSSEGYSQKTFWWSKGYSAMDEPAPDLMVTGFHLDQPSIKLHALRATHAVNSDIGSAMLVGVVLPSAGCWEITGQYKDGLLTYVIWIP